MDCMPSSTQTMPTRDTHFVSGGNVFQWVKLVDGNITIQESHHQSH